MDKCQLVDCPDDAKWSELWRVGEAKAVVRVCQKHSVAGQKGSRTTAAPGLPHVEAQADRQSVDA